MSWLTPYTALYAAAAAVPLLLALYFLKLKRRELVISSTLLWRRAVQDLQVNAPFQRLRRNLLLLLQLLAIAAALVALGRPILRLTSGDPKRCVILIDRSASMNATDVLPSRLDVARKQAKELIGSLRSQGVLSLGQPSDQAMVLAFDEHAKVMCNFTSDKAQLAAAVDAIQPTDGSTSLAEAFTVARAYAQPAGEGVNNRSNEVVAQLELFSDGRIPDAERLTADQDKLNFHRVGTSGRNVALTAMQARRNYENPAEVEVFAALSNGGDRAVDCDLQLSVDGSVRAVRQIRVPAATPPGPGRPAASPGAISATFTLTHAQAGVVEVRLRAAVADNALAFDDAAWAILAAPRSLRTLLVTAGNLPLVSALKACPQVQLEQCSPAEFDAMDLAALSANPRHDVIVLDGHAPAKLPRGRFLVFGRPPAASGLVAGAELKNQVAVDWRSRHPVLQYVNLNNLFASRVWKVAPPSEASVLAEFGECPALLLVRREGSVFLVAPFDCSETNWPFETSFVIFLYNATGYLGVELGLDSPERSSLRVNQAISLEGLPAGAKAKVRGPGIPGAELAASDAGTLRYPGTGRAGVYEVSVPERPTARFAVNLLDEGESSIEPAGTLRLLGQEVAAQKEVVRASAELWPFLGALALGLVCLEWWVYKRKVRV